MDIHIDNKKLLESLAIVAGVILCIIIGLCLKKCSSKNATKDLARNNYLLFMEANEVLEKYEHYCSKFIDNSGYFNPKTGFEENNSDAEYCYNVKTTVNALNSYFINCGAYEIIDSLMKEALKDAEIIGQHTDDKSLECIDVFTKVKQVVSLSKEVNCSVLELRNFLNSNCREISASVEKLNLHIGNKKEDLDKEHLKLVLKKQMNLINLEKREKDKLANEKKKGQLFMEKVAQKKDVIKLKSGVCYKVLKNSSSKIKPQPDSEIYIYYEGRLIDNTVFDSNYTQEEPMPCVPNQMIPGFGEAVTYMTEGSEWEIYIPENLAYGEQGSGPIEPYSTLIFKVKLVRIE